MTMMKLWYNVKSAPTTSIHYNINNKVRSTQHGQLRFFNIHLFIYSTLGDINHHGTSKFINHCGAKKKKTKKNKKIENQKLGKNVGLSKYIHT